MAKFRKQTSHLIEELINLRNSRSSIDDFNFNFLKNFSENSQLMHFHLQKDKNADSLLEVAHRQYFVFLVSCWETFFRDLFIFINSNDVESIERLLTTMNISEKSPELKNITLVELLSKSFNFQNISDLESAYSNLWSEDFLESICTTETALCGLNGKVSEKFCISKIFPDWRELIDISFEIRHKIVHDANYRPKNDFDLIQKAEALFLILPQIVTYLVAKRYKLKYMALSDGELTVPYIFTMKDILATDWKVLN